MKFYKRDPDAALAGMMGLTLKERGAYNTILDLLYSRDGVLPDEDDFLRSALGCHGNEWLSVKAALIRKKKIWIEDGYVKANRVENTLKEAGNFSENQRIRARKRWEMEGKAQAKSGKDQQNQTNEDAKGGNALIAIATAIDITKKENTPPIGSPPERKPVSSPEDYFFVGKLIRVSKRDAAAWRESYPLVPDLRAELAAADAYYAGTPPKNGNWFFAVSNWLKKAHLDEQKKREEERRARTSGT
jgi:uncharacterized protein YdaU (DUF1376 family)